MTKSLNLVANIFISLMIQTRQLKSNNVELL